MIGIAEIKRHLPHRYPMLLVDRVTSYDDTTLTAVKAITANEPWYADLPDHADHAYPASLLVESWMQAAGLLVGLSAGIAVPDGQVPLAGRLTDVRVVRPVLPGDLAEHHVRLLKQAAGTLVVTGDTTVDGHPVLTVDRALLTFRPATVLIPGTPVLGA
ncbi:hypothetical protein [Actinosynnema sp. NPDC020468]|uniref:3-hydroxyacyl-ACP dehydratase FabZ family protein n=1 Tax=Actinosynnema sp. NPDC020468 TaxID=3154488 RepID=UPI0033F6874D